MIQAWESDSTVYYNYDDRFSQGDNNIETDQVLGNRHDFSSNAGTLDREDPCAVVVAQALGEKSGHFEEKPDMQTPNGSEAVIGEDHIHPCDQMLLHSLERIKSMEFDLDKTKRVLHGIVMKQLEIAKLMENLQGTSNLGFPKWL
ncbi:hypothetical protein POM88_024124 [Heracleum sosnowskyi]|uniref:Uncharacterized protein n=1 Tax=Heracleum sosnowskyi TaxID=360622 RepID=A0AAD8MVA2_9APIA|nr:hypothetical protein POM88_024124 [Heracleum sosnowskyi]